MIRPLLGETGSARSRLPRPAHEQHALKRRGWRASSITWCALAWALACILPALGRFDACADETVPLAPPRIAGVLADSGDTIERWCWSGAWVYPVGDPRAFGEPECPGATGYRVLRPVLRGRRSVTHQGADLGNNRGGGTVRAAASGLVVRATNSHSSGYGEHVVLAHRLDDGGLVYSVYAHLVPGSIAVREGEIVPLGQLIGRVGRSGRASTEHLHFEIRRPQNLELRWEQAAVEDPLAFIGKRLTSAPDTASWASPYLAWAQASALIERNATTAAPLERAIWWGMLARAARHSLHDLPSDVELAQRLLMELGVLGGRGAGMRLNDRGDSDRVHAVGWAELHEDLKRLADVGIRLPACLAFGKLADLADLKSLRPAAGEGERSKTPTLADACFELAELASSKGAPEPLPSP